MAVVYYTKIGEYVVAECDCVDKHYECVRELVLDTDETAYKDNMRKGTGLVVSKDGVDVGFLYAYEKAGVWYGTSIYGVDVVGTCCLMVEFTKLHGYVPIRFTPHEGMISKMKAIVDGESIRGYWSDRPYVVVRTKELEDRFARVFDLYKITA